MACDLGFGFTHEMVVNSALVLLQEFQVVGPCGLNNNR